MAPLAESFAAAAKILARVAAGRSLSAEIERAGAEANETRAAVDGARSALIDLCYGTLRRYGRSQALVKALSSRGQITDPLVEALLWCALYALEGGRYAEYTVVDQAARACVLMNQHRAKGFVNAVLRNYLRSRPSLEARIGADPVARYWHPEWWIERVRAAYPADGDSVLAAGNSHPPMTLRVNARRSATQDCLARLAAQGVAARVLDAQALILEKPLPVARLPGFAEGLVSVQDAGAQRAAPLLDLAPGQRVLDACAAPGGKTAHILELADVTLIALDIDAARCADVERNLARLGLAAQVRVADCAERETWWDGKFFDRILADVPCSASGIARRHPDAKWLRRAADLERFAARQARILDSLWRTLAPGGKLLYVTCSVFTEENGAVIDAFLARTSGARRAPRAGSGQLLPGPEHDGFFFALLEKPA